MQREQIIQVTLDLIQEKESAGRVNLREVARVLGCAHTNIYNYFDDFDQLLWAALDEAGDRFNSDVEKSLTSADPETSRLKCFWGSFINFYLNHKGWFRLFWADPLKFPRPAESSSAGKQRIARLASLFGGCIRADYGLTLPPERVFNMMHIVHCYLHGEISIFISGRGLIREEKTFRENLLAECLHLTDLIIMDQRSQAVA